MSTPRPLAVGAAVAGLLLAGGAVVEARQPAAPAGSPTRIELRVEPAVALWAEARALAESPSEPGGPLAPLVEALRGLGAKLPRGQGWGRFDSGLLDVTSAEEIATRLSGVSTLRLRGGGEVDVAAEMQRVGAALRAVDATYRAELWPRHREAISTALADVETRLLPKQSEAFALMLRSLGMVDPERTIPVYLVHRSAWPGAATYRDRSGTGFSIVAVDFEENRGSALLEIVLHEATHALDLATEQDARDTVLTRLRDRLRDAGLGPGDSSFHDLPHTLMFAQAGETIRRVIDAQHVHYGDGTSTYYDRVTHARLVRDLWVEHLDGERTLDEVLDRLVAAATESND